MLLCFAQGCGHVSFISSRNNAEKAVQLAEKKEADVLSPYHYYYAVAHLEKSHEEASEGSYDRAVLYADIATTSAIKATKQSIALATEKQNPSDDQPSQTAPSQAATP